MIIGDLPRRNAFRYPDQPAIECGATCLTWAQFNQRVNRLARALLAGGLGRPERIAILARPSTEVAELYFAAAKAGLVIVPIHPGLAPKDVAFILDDVQARAVVLGEEATQLFGEVAEAAKSVRMRAVIGTYRDWLRYQELLSGPPAGEPGVAVGEDDLFSIRFTSGTTGRSKGCPNSHRDWLMRSRNLLIHVAHSHRDRALLFVPLALGVGSSMLMTYAMVGAHVVIQPGFDAGEVLSAVESRRVSTFMTPVPALLAKLLEHPRSTPEAFASVRVVGYGGAVFPVPLLLGAIERLRCDFFGIYGSLEAGGFSTYLLPEDHRLEGLSQSERAVRERRLASCGREALQADLRVVDEHGAELPRGEVGELVVRTEGMIKSYWNMPGEIDKTMREGWYRTGDAASMDEDGYIYISDRIKDIIKTGGINVSAVEVEKALLEHPAVAEAAVVGMPDERWGEAVIAFVVPRRLATEPELLGHCRARLAGFKVPKAVRFVDALPKNPMGKILKRELRKPA